MDVLVPELERDVVRRHAEAKRPAVDVHRRDGRVAGLVNTSGRGGRVGVEQSRRQTEVAEARCHVDVRRGAALEEAAADVRAIDERVLRRRGFVIDAARIHVGAAVQQEVGNRDGLRLVERLLAVPSARVHERGVGRDQSLQLVEPAEPRRHIGRQRRAATDEESRGVLVRVVEHGVRAVLPVASQVHVGAGGDQHLEHLRALRGDVRGTLAEVEHRRVDLVPNVRGCEELSHAAARRRC